MRTLSLKFQKARTKIEVGETPKLYILRYVVNIWLRGDSFNSALHVLHVSKKLVGTVLKHPFSEIRVKQGIGEILKEMVLFIWF